MREVSKEEFYRIICDEKLDVYPVPEGRHPFTTIWYYRDRRIFGKCVPTEVDSKKYPKYPWYEEHWYVY